MSITFALTAGLTGLIRIFVYHLSTHTNDSLYTNEKVSHIACMCSHVNSRTVLSRKPYH